MYARRKLANLEFEKKNYLDAALQFEKILDFVKADECYAKSISLIKEQNDIDRVASSEIHEQYGDYLVRKGCRS
jgi:hypothetical protein